jgi:hypothetical protein
MIVDIYNYRVNKQLNQPDRLLMAVMSGSCVTPKFQADPTGMRVLSQLVRDWQIGAVLRYQSGALIQSPPSNNQLMSQLARQSPDFLKSVQTFWNYVPGVNALAVDPNCGRLNPKTTRPERGPLCRVAI